jgi:hypothetical protein
MLRSWIAMLLCVVLWVGTPLPCAARGVGDAQEPTIQEALVLMPAGSAIEVKT